MNRKSSLGQRRCGPWLNAIALRRSRIYKPLAILLSILLAPAVSWMPAGGSGAALFQAKAAPNCASTTNSIIQNYCDANGNLYLADLGQLESDAVNGYLAEHNLPVTDASVIYTYGRSDLRSAIRAQMMTLILVYINTPAAARTTHQQAVVSWFTSLVQKNEIANYQNAVNQYELWMADPCDFTLDPNIAQQYNLKYDGTPWCGGGTLASIFDPNLGVPAESYFTTYGLVHSYGAVASADPNYGVVLGQSSASLETALAVAGVASGIIATAIAGGSLGAGLTTTVTTLTIVAASTVNTLQGTLPIDTITATTVIPATMVLVPVAIILMAVAIGVSAGLEAFNYADELSDLNNLKATLNQLLAAPPDLAAMSSDSSGQGMFKLQNTFLSRTLTGVCQGSTSTADPASVPCAGATPSDVPSTTALPAHRPGVDLAFAIPNSSTTEDSFSYRDWNGAIWTVQTWNGWFVQTCAAGSAATLANGTKLTGTCAQPDSMIADISYIDWSIPPDPTLSGDRGQWTASRYGSNFTLVKSVTGTSEKPCAASPSTGLTPLPAGGKFDACSSYVSQSFNLIGGNGFDVSMVLAPYATPTLAAPYYFSFTDGTPGNEIIAAVGNPKPAVTVTSGTLAADPDFKISGSGTSSITVAFDGSATAKVGSYTLTLQATGYSGATQSQTYTINVGSGLAVTSPGTLNADNGVPVNFLITTTGVPFPKISADSNLNLSARGLTLIDHGNGTATISGTPPAGALGFQCIYVNNAPCGIIAANVNGAVEQQFVINLTPPPPAQFIPPLSATFNTGEQNEAPVFTAGAASAVTLSLGSAPSWVKFHDNGDGTGTISGDPPVGTAGIFNLDLSSGTAGTLFTFGGTFAINVVDNPLITSANTATFTVGTQGTMPITASQGQLSLANNLPTGLSFFIGSTLNCLSCSASISGTPAAGTGGQYQFVLTAATATGTATQNVLLNINEAPHITSPNLVVLFAGQPASFAVTTTGYPSTSAHPVAANAAPPANPSQGNGMYFTTSGLPASLSATNLNSVGLATGILTVTGTPKDSDLGIRQVQVSAQNAVGAKAQQTFTLEIYPYDPTSRRNLFANWALSRDSSNNVVATVVVANGSGAALQNVAITSATIGSAAGAITPSSVASIAPASSATFTITFPGSSVGASGTGAFLVLSGTDSGGAFRDGGRFTLP